MKTKKLRLILVPIDFSPASIETLRFAKRLAAKSGAGLHLLHVVTPLPEIGFGRVRIPAGYSAAEISAVADRRLRGLVSKFLDASKLNSATVRLGAPADEIVAVALETRADLIAIATRGFTGLKRAFIGSTTERVVRHATCPVFVVRDAADKRSAQRARPAVRFRKILVPLDFSDCSRFGLDYAVDFARQSGSRLLLFHSLVPHAYALSDEYTALEAPKLLDFQREDATTEMEKLRRTLSKKSLKIETVITVGSPVEQINECIESHGVDLVIISTHGRTGLKRMFIGSVAEHIVRHATVSVVVVPNRPVDRAT